MGHATQPASVLKSLAHPESLPEPPRMDPAPLVQDSSKLPAVHLDEPPESKLGFISKKEGEDMALSPQTLTFPTVAGSGKSPHPTI